MIQMHCWVCGKKTSSPLYHVIKYHKEEMENLANAFMEDDDTTAEQESEALNNQ